MGALIQHLGRFLLAMTLVGALIALLVMDRSVGAVGVLSSLATLAVQFYFRKSGPEL